PGVLLRAATGAGQAQRGVPAACGDTGAVQCLACAGVGDVCAGAEGELRRDQDCYPGLSWPVLCRLRLRARSAREPEAASGQGVREAASGEEVVVFASRGSSAQVFVAAAFGLRNAPTICPIAVLPVTPRE